MTTLADEIAALLLKALNSPEPAPDPVKPAPTPDARPTRTPRKGGK